MIPFHFSITTILILMNVVVFFISQNRPHMLERMLFVTNRVLRFREYDRLFLSGFAHAGVLHLVFNMLTLYFFGPALEQAIGRTLFLLLFLISIVGGNLYCLWMRNDSYGYAALGASGGVLGVIFGYIAVAPFSQLSIMILPVFIPGWLFGILFSLISLLLTQLPRAEEARISHEGHLGGAFFGALFVLLSGAADVGIPETLYFYLGGLVPIAVFALIKLLAPGLLYRHLRK